MKTDKTQTTSNGNVISGPKYCGDPPPTTTSDPSGEQDSMRVSSINIVIVIINITWQVMSYNLYGWNALVQNPWKAENVYKAIRNVQPDILGAQECEGREHDVAANIGSDYAVAGAASAGHSIIYRTSVFTLDGHGTQQLNEMDQYGPVRLIVS